MLKPILTAATFLLLLGAEAQTSQVSSSSGKTGPKFIDEISFSHSSAQTASFSIETATALQFKFALLLDTEVEMVSNSRLFQTIDDWYGTRYRMGGTTKAGIDCSAFMQVLFTSIYGLSIPRTAREQYAAATHISRTEIREGDLVFFNTTGGVSHVGMYLQNNKFVHASSSGVVISDLFDDYWVRRFIGVGRMDEITPVTTLNTKP